MSTPSIIKYPYDPTGLAETNLIVGEPHVIPLVKNRAFALHAGPFYANSVVVRTADTNVTLVRNTDYVILYTYQEATRKVGQEICAVIHVTNTAYSGTLLVDYQVIGGEFSSNVSAIQQLLQSLEIDNRAIVFDDLIDFPVTLPPAPHLHDVGDLYGMEALVDAINDLKNSIGNNTETLYDQLASRVANLETRASAAEANVAELFNEVVRIDSELTAIRARLSTNETNIAALTDDSKYTPIEGGNALSVRKRYLLISNGRNTLPNTAGLTVGAVVRCSKVSGLTPEYQTFNQSNERIRYANQLDTVVKQTTNSELRFIYAGQGTWECVK